MVIWLNFECLWFYILFVKSIKSQSILSNSSNVQLLGLFSDASDTSGRLTTSTHTRAMFEAAVILSQQYNITIEGKPIGYQSAQTGGNVIDALTKTCQIISNSNILGIVGPELSRETHFLIPFAGKIGIPVISFGSTDPELSDRNVHTTFYRTVPSDNTGALAIVNLFIYFNWTSVVIIYQNDAFGIGGSNSINDIFHKYNLTVTQMIIYDITRKSVRDNLKSLLNSISTRII